MFNTARPVGPCPWTSVRHWTTLSGLKSVVGAAFWVCGVERHRWTLCNKIVRFTKLVGSCVLVQRSESRQVNTAPWTQFCGSPLQCRLTQRWSLLHVDFCAAGGRFRKRTGMFFIHFGAPSCRNLQCRSADRVYTFTGLPHQHWKHSKQNKQPSLSANMPHCIAVFASDSLRHGVMIITVSRLSSLVSSCLDSGSTATLL